MPALRKRIEHGTLLSIRRGKRVYSHPLLALYVLRRLCLTVVTRLGYMSDTYRTCSGGLAQRSPKACIVDLSRN